MIIEILKQRLKEKDSKKGFLLDGFPRTSNKGKMLTSTQLKIDYIFEISVSKEEIFERMAGRLYHPASGRTYHRLNNPPKKPGLDDITGEALLTRKDDEPETVRHRLNVYEQQTAPLISYYQKANEGNKLNTGEYHQISGEQDVETINQEIMAHILKSN